MSENQCTNITSEAIAKATPLQGCSQRHTDSPPKNVAIQPKTGVQMGSPVKRLTKKSTATVQWITREESLWRTISPPATTSSA